MELNKPLATVTPTLDGEVLAVLAKVDTAFTAGQLRRVLGHHSEEGVRKVLRRLARQGVVHVEKAGNAFLHRLNHDHLAAQHIIGLARLLETFLARLEERLESWPVPPVYAAVFGSAARGTMTVDSDLDLLLVRPDDADDDLWDAQVAHLVADVGRWTGNDPRPLQFTAAEVEARGVDEPVLRDVLDEGLTVAGNRSWLAGRLRKEKG
ncbi:nucleotidyltransferase domain-containing protein [Umezawaea tangerina]|uniref:Nucleotidyltransferase-like protein n=1 Tax=Umezawaea tangerina TaxID=84725 RepID=A0A2T0SPC7_9PSEU|nr:nucleotidyltransferase domain-containing protein [Umezawaea tangerina]PRY35269.1 nucleotidyltransferase-like protein [Umezawaea tangerina]